MTGEFFSQLETCHKNDDDLAWYLSVDSKGKVTAIPDAKERGDKNVDFIVKMPEEQAVFSKSTTTDCRGSVEKPPQTSHARKSNSSTENAQSQNGMHGSLVQRAFSSRAVGRHCASQCSDVRQSSSDSQYSQSERSYSFTDSMEIAGFTSDSSLESFKGMYDRRL